MTSFFSERLTTLKDFVATQHLPTNQLANLFSRQYWSTTDLPADSPYYLATLGLILLVIILLIIGRSWLLRRHQQVPVYDHAADQIINLIIFITLISLSYLFFRSQQIQYLSSRLVVLAATLITLIWIGLTLWQIWRVLPSKHQQHLEKERFFRYLPKKKTN